MKKGVEEGVDKGKDERRVEMAKKKLENSMDADRVREITG